MIRVPLICAIVHPKSTPNYRAARLAEVVRSSMGQLILTGARFAKKPVQLGAVSPNRSVPLFLQTAGIPIRDLSLHEKNNPDGNCYQEV